MRRFGVRIGATLVVGALWACGSGGGDTSAVEDAAMGGAGGAAADASSPDANATHGGSPAPADTGPPPRSDVGPQVNPDVGADVGPDVGPAGGPDVGPDGPDAQAPSPDSSASTTDAAVAPGPDGAAPMPDAFVEPTPDGALAPTPDAASPPTPDAAPTPDAGPPPDPFAGVSDEFDDAATLRTRWRLRHEVEDTAPQHTLLDIDQSNPGQFTVQPTTSGWFAGYVGPFLYQHVRGDILLEIQVTAGRVNLPDAAPAQAYNSAGLVVRDPAHGPGADNWLMLNVGYQAGFVGTETKTTVNSVSELRLDMAPHRGRLRVCRVGTTYVMARFLTNDARWTEIRRYERPDLPDEVQLGLVTNGWNSQNDRPNPNIAPDLLARFEYARFRRPVDLADCLSGP